MHQYNIFNHILKDKLRTVYLNISLQSFALAMVSIFVPIYLLKLGYSLHNVLIWAMTYWISFGMFMPLSAFLSSKIGFKHIMLFRLPLTILALLLLNYLGKLEIPVYIIAVVLGLSDALYVLPLTSLFAKYSNKIHRGLEVGKLLTFPYFAAILSPLIGGWIATKAGFNNLFIIASLLLLISVFPLFYSKDLKPSVNFSFRKIKRYMNEDLKMVLGFALSSIRNLSLSLLFPIFVFFQFKDLEIVGYAFTLLLLGTAVFNMFVGKLSDKYGERVLFHAGGLLAFAVFLLLLFVDSRFDVLFLSFFAGMAFALLQIPFEKMIYDRAARHNVTEYLVYRELMISFFRVLYFILLILVVDTFYIGFGLASLTSLAYLLF